MQRIQLMIGGTVTLLVLCGASGAFASQLALGNVSGQNGQSVTVPVTYRHSRGRVAVAVGTDITYDRAVLTNPRCDTGSAVSTSGPAAKMVVCGQPKPGVLRLAVVGLNTAPLPDGEVATVTFDVASTKHHRIHPLRHKPGASDAHGTDFRLTRRNGAIRTN
jgi:hypothetical protein